MTEPGSEPRPSGSEPNGQRRSKVPAAVLDLVLGGITAAGVVVMGIAGRVGTSRTYLRLRRRLKRR